VQVLQEVQVQPVVVVVHLLQLQGQLLQRSLCLLGGRCDMINTVDDTTSTTTPDQRLGKDHNPFRQAGRCEETLGVGFTTSITTLGKRPGKGLTLIGCSRWLLGRGRGLG